MYQKWEKLQPDEPLGVYVDFTFYLSTCHDSVCHKSCLPQLYDVTKPIISFPLQAQPFLVRFREALGNRWISVSWAPQFAQNLYLGVDSASCWYN